ncbi:MAG: hypothetical protein RLZZ600_944 [Actinomycetota bacterium]
MTTSYGEFLEPGSADAATAVAVDGAIKREKNARRRRTTMRILLLILLILLMLGIRLLPIDWNPFTSLAGGIGTGTGQGVGGSGTGSGSGSGGNGGGSAAGVGGTDSKGGKNGSGSGGISAPAGADGKPGPAGPAGANGAQGPAGANGATGANGADGAPGRDGSNFGVPIGQGEINVGACDSAVSISLRSSWSTAENTFVLSRVKLYNVATTCNGQDLTLVLLDSAGHALATIEANSVTVSGNGDLIYNASVYPQLAQVISTQVSRVAIELAG